MPWWPTAPTGGTTVTVDCVVKGTDESSTSTSVQDDDELLIAVGANEKWIFFFYLHFIQSSNDIRFNISVPSGTRLLGPNGLYINASAGNVSSWFASSAVDMQMDLDMDGAVQCLVAGVSVGGSGGNVVFRFGVVTGGTATIKAGSAIYGVRIS